MSYFPILYKCHRDYFRTTFGPLYMENSGMRTSHFLVSLNQIKTLQAKSSLESCALKSKSNPSLHHLCCQVISHEICNLSPSHVT